MGEKEKFETSEHMTEEKLEQEIESDDNIENTTTSHQTDTGDLTEENATALKEEKVALEQEIEELNERILRVQAEYENYRKRTEKERTAARKYEAESLATELLQVIDNFERALQTEVAESNQGFYDGVKMVYDQFIQALSTQGVEVMEVENEPFDPNLHHAVMQEDDDSIESNIVTEELQKGYMLKDKVIRPAMVKVNK